MHLENFRTYIIIIIIVLTLPLVLSRIYRNAFKSIIQITLSLEFLHKSSIMPSNQK